MIEEWIKKRTTFYLVLLLFFMVALRLLYTAYYPDVDEVLYITAAKNILAGEYHPLDVWHSPMLRYGFVGIVSIFVYLFGATHFGVLWFPLLATIGTFFVIYFTGKKLFNERTALIACFLFSIFPLNVKYATVLEADVVISFLMGICLLLYLYRKMIWSYLLIGLILGVGIFVKFFILLLLPVLCIDLLKQRQIKPIVFMGLGLLIGSVPFLLYQYVEAGDVLYHISLDKELAVEYKDVHLIEFTEGFSFTDYMFNPFIKKPEPSLFGIYFYLFLIALFYSLYKREWNNYMLWLWVILGYLVIELHPLIMSIQRYLMIIEIPFILFIASFITKIKGKKYLYYAL